MKVTMVIVMVVMMMMVMVLMVVVVVMLQYYCGPGAAVFINDKSYVYRLLNGR